MNVFLIMAFLAAFSLFSSTIFRNIGFDLIINSDALMIVGGGTVVAVFLGFPIKRLRKTVNDLLDAFRTPRSGDETAKDILDITRIYRKGDIRRMEKKIKSLKDDFLKMGVSLLINNKSSEEIRSILERGVAARMMDFNFSQNVLKTISRLTPSFGLAGTVISLIKMFQNMESLEAIAPHMAVAMMSTFYGVILANLFMLPLCAKLEEHALQSEARMLSIIEGIEGINNNDHLINIEDRINGYKPTWEITPGLMKEPAIVSEI
ncbi:MAG: MotA/TolQ/ExbB proton channel family protein [Nitrospirae bacterium]|nr:MotA/TolQ/ExbB proton channel family protein [Nitrospirota bacterium]MBI3593912.1 MotA/TolQ/ExbB proton channel family protein [Nitrospirota bacterium]